MAPTFISTTTPPEAATLPTPSPSPLKVIPATHFAQQSQFYVDPQSTILVSKYQSSETGLTVVHVDLDSKSISAFFIILFLILQDSSVY